MISVSLLFFIQVIKVRKVQQGLVAILVQVVNQDQQVPKVQKENQVHQDQEPKDVQERRYHKQKSEPVSKTSVLL